MSWLPFLDKAIDLIFPDAETRAKVKMQAIQLEHDGKLKELDAILQTDLAQARINEADSKSGSKFQAWWRPTAAWLCVFGLAYPVATSLLVWLIQLIVWIAPVSAETIKAMPLPPVIDTAALVPLLIGMLGLGSMRSWERDKSHTNWGK